VEKERVLLLRSEWDVFIFCICEYELGRLHFTHAWIGSQNGLRYIPMRTLQYGAPVVGIEIGRYIA
jgi:hypothetical protein